MLRLRAPAVLLAMATFAHTRTADAATWAQGTTPHLRQIFSVDRTEEPNWIYGSKDVFADGPAFGIPEQQHNLRTAYAAADPMRLWLRVYVSNATAVDPSVTVFVFIDADQNPATGGGTVSSVLSPQFTAEHSPGGYEFAFGMTANATIAGLWTWQQSTMTYVPVTLAPTDTTAEIGSDTDPIGIAFNGTELHGYVQGTVLLSLVGLTPACNGNLYVRSAAMPPPSDLDMAFYTSCVPATQGGIPNIVVPPTGCTSDAQCPQNGVCSNGQCVLAPTCVTTADCATNQMCTADGRCIPATGACTSNAACPSGQECAPNGTCVVGTGGALPSGSHVEGGAFNCAVSRQRDGGLALVVLGALLGLFVRRRAHRA